MKPVAIFRFSPTEAPGHFGEWLDARGLVDWWRSIAVTPRACRPARSAASR
jgi:hypothetical protein